MRSILSLSFVSRVSKHVYNCRTIYLFQYPVKEITFQCTDLYDDTEYEFRVSAENRVGSGPPSAPSVPFIARDPWSKSPLF